MKYRVNTNLINYFNANGNIAALAFYYMVKLTFKNSLIYKNKKGKVSSRMVADMFNISHCAANKYINTLKQEGLCEVHNGNLLFVSLKRIDEYKHQIKKNCVPMEFESGESLKDIATKLKAAIIFKNVLNQQFMINLKSDLKNETKFNSKHYKKYLSGKGEKAKEIKDLNLSNAKIGKMLNCSVQNASTLKKKFKEMGLIQFVRVFKVVGNVGMNQNTKRINSCFNGKTFVSRLGLVYEFQFSKVIAGDSLKGLLSGEGFIK